MRVGLLEYLWCPDCEGELALEQPVWSGKTIVGGALACRSCSLAFPICDGVPSFVDGDDGKDDGAVHQTTDGFAKNWEAYNRVILSNELLNRDLFADWIWPLQPSHFEDKVVVEAGCGMGRWLRLAAEHRPRALIGFDYSNIVRTAARNVAHLDNVHVVQADIFRLPFRRVVDVQYSIGVVHHTPDPAKAFASLASLLAPDGVISCWVYGAENNGWITRFVDPVRKRVTSRLSPGSLRVLSGLAALQLRGGSEVYRLLGAPAWLPYRDYIVHLREYPFDYMTHIVYDHLVPSLAHYIKHEEVLDWVQKAGLSHAISPRNANSWRVFGARSPRAADAAIAPLRAADVGVQLA